MARYYILGNRRDNANERSSMSPMFSPGSSSLQGRNDKNEEDLKKLIAKMVTDFWQIDHEIHRAQQELERKRRDSHPFYEEVVTKPHPTAMGTLLTGRKKGSLPSDTKEKNLVVESSMMAPEFQRHQLRKTKSNIYGSNGNGGISSSKFNKNNKNGNNNNSNNNNKKNGMYNNHRVARPESREDFLALDFASRCAVAGLQLGRTKVFLRREAFDRIEGMRSEKFFNAAAAMQKIVRGRQVRFWYEDMRHAAIIVQCFMRIKIAERKLSATRVRKAAIAIQCGWRVFVSRMYVFEVQLARRTAAMIIQRKWRYYKNLGAGPTEEDIIYSSMCDPNPSIVLVSWQGESSSVRV